MLIAGDSFAYPGMSANLGWPSLLAEKYNVTNISSPGIGEFKILQALKSQDLSQFDIVLVSHTSPYRVHCEKNPLYIDGHLYQHSDLLFADVEDKSKTDPLAKALCNYFYHVFDTAYYEYVHNSFCRDIEQLTQQNTTIHITHFEWQNLYLFKNLKNFYELWKDNRGNYSHYNKHASRIVLDWIVTTIDNRYS
jgi:hypothetical protein